MPKLSAAFPDPACLLPDERAILANVLSSPEDANAKLVYADWLEERNDARGAFLRTWVQSPAEDRLPPGVSKSWLSLLGATLRSQLRPFAKQPWAEAATRSARPGVIVSTKPSKGKAPRGASKVGGLPDLPAETEWPEAENGPAAFVAQWNLEELAASPVCLPLPRTGLLSVFIDLLPFIEDAGDGVAKVIYSPDLNDLEEREPDEERDEANVLSECRVSYHEWLTIPHSASTALSRFKLTGAQRDAYSDFYFDRYAALASGIPPGSHQLLGHACPIQSYPIPEGAGWQLLCQLGPDEAAGLEACDGGTWYLTAKSSDLKRANFDNVNMTFDTG